MSGARDAAKMTRGLADVVDSRGNDFLDLMSTFSSEGKSFNNQSPIIDNSVDFSDALKTKYICESFSFSFSFSFVILV